MKLINITKLVKSRTKDIVTNLMPEFTYVRVSNSGIVTLKEKWWSIPRTIINITDLYIDVFPKKLAESCQRKGYGKSYNQIFSNDLYVMLQLRAYKKDINIVDYIWKKFNLLHREVPIITTVQTVRALSSSMHYLPVVSPISRLYIPGVEKLIRSMYKKDTFEDLLQKITKIQFKRPQFLVRLELPQLVQQYA
jgi:hypothetical protein